MLSNTADRTPKPATDGQDGVGSDCTGISEAAATSSTRTVVPFIPGLISFPSGAANGLVTAIAALTDRPSHGNLSPIPAAFAMKLVATAFARMKVTVPTRFHS